MRREEIEPEEHIYAAAATIGLGLMTYFINRAAYTQEKEMQLPSMSKFLSASLTSIYMLLRGGYMYWRRGVLHGAQRLWGYYF